MSHGKAALNGAVPTSLSADERPLLPRSGGSNGAGGRQQQLSSVQSTFGNVVISIVGAGVLGMPYSFKQAGWAVGASLLAMVGLSCFYTMLLLVRSKRKLEGRGIESVQSLSDLGFATFGNPGRLAVDFLVVITQGSFCVGYLIFIGENLASVFAGGDVPNFTRDDSEASGLGSKGIGGLNWHSKAAYLWILFPLQIVLATIRSLTKLAPFSMVADFVNMSAMAVVMSDDAIELQRSGVHKSVEPYTGWGSLAFVIGVALYAFEGFGLVIPIESSMKDRSRFGSTLASAMGFITALFITFSLLGYLAFGEETKDIVTLNLGGSWHTAVIKLALCFGLFFTFPVMMHPVYEVLERRLKRIGPSTLLRAVTVLVIVWTAVSVPHFGDFLSLMGSSVCCMMSFILPGMFHLRAHAGELQRWERLVDYAIISFGVLFAFGGTWFSIQNWS